MHALTSVPGSTAVALHWCTGLLISTCCTQQKWCNKAGLKRVNHDEITSSGWQQYPQKHRTAQAVLRACIICSSTSRVHPNALPASETMHSTLCVLQHQIRWHHPPMQKQQEAYWLGLCWDLPAPSAPAQSPAWASAMPFPKQQGREQQQQQQRHHWTADGPKHPWSQQQQQQLQQQPQHS